MIAKAIIQRSMQMPSEEPDSASYHLADAQPDNTPTNARSGRAILPHETPSTSVRLFRGRDWLPRQAGRVCRRRRAFMTP
jgi:hypothetical protein